MAGSTEQNPYSEVFSRIVGCRVLQASRILYEVEGGTTSDDGALELVLEGMGPVLFDGAGDGETLRVKNGPWVDPFQKPLDAENREYVRQYGKWSRMPVTSDKGYEDVVGSVIEKATLLQNQFGKPGGVRLTFTHSELWFVVECDEARVYWAAPPSFSLLDVFSSHE